MSRRAAPVRDAAVPGSRGQSPRLPVSTWSACTYPAGRKAEVIGGVWSLQPAAAAVFPRGRTRWSAVAVCGLLLLGGGIGCTGKPRPARDAVGRGDAEGGMSAGRGGSRVSRDKLLDSALTVLDRFDDFDEARGVELVFDRINQWARLAPGGEPSAWEADPLLATLPERLRVEADAVAPAALAFTADGDVAYLRDQRWLADIARTARGDALDDVAIARNLFRWTVRSLAIVGDPPMAPSEGNPGTRWFLPGEIVLAGRASGPQRAWIFLQLLRHAGLDGVMLATGDRAAGTLRGWVPALLSGGEAYLFEPTYGMPIPAADGAGVATLREVVADASILEALSLPDRPYPVQSSDLAGLVALVAADPWSLSRRMALLDPEVRGAREMRVAVDASRLGTAAAEALRAAGLAQTEPALWDFPWETLARRRSAPSSLAAALRAELGPLQVPFVPQPGAGTVLRQPLLAARLREFRGDVDGPEGAKAAYLAARASRGAVASAVAELSADRAASARALFARMKEDAAYWLGVLTLAEGEYDTAIDYLGRMTVEAAPDSRWIDAARANLAQALIGVGRIPEAVAALRGDLSPQRYGSRLLADQLEAARAAPDATPAP